MADKDGSTPRERAKLIYLRSRCEKPLQIIADEVNVPLNTIKTWKKRDKWDEDKKAVPKRKKVAPKPETTEPETETRSKPGEPAKPGKKMGPPKGNRNAVYAGAPKGNRNGLSTGEHVRITYDTLTDSEKVVFGQAVHAVEIGDYTGQTSTNLAILIIREQRMLRMIEELRNRSERGMIVDESVSGSNTAGTGRNALRSTHQTATAKPVEDRILRIEEALTRVQQTKQKILDSLRDFALRDDQMDMERGRYEREFGTPEDSDEGLTIIYDYGEGDQ